MADTWSMVEDAPFPAARPVHTAEPPGELRRLVRDSLYRELQSRRGRAPHAQLGVIVGADPATIDKAFTRLRAQFNPDAYAAHGAQAVAFAREIFDLVHAAFWQLDSPAARKLHALPPIKRAWQWLRTLLFRQVRHG